MVGPIPAKWGRIGICYRREETAYSAGWLYDRLVDHFGEEQVVTIDPVEPGDDVPDVIANAVGSCDVLLVLIGDGWLTITDAQGRRRLENPDDFVRLELEAALTRNIRLIPVLVNGASMPEPADLPASLVNLVGGPALVLSPGRLAVDTSRLLKVLDTTLAEEPGALDREP
jgi:hypothetical protein